MDSSYQKTTTQQLPQHGKIVKRKGLQKLALRPDTNVPQSLDFSLDGNSKTPAFPKEVGKGVNG